MHSNSTDAELLARAVEEPVLFAALFERHGQAVRRYAIRRVGGAGDDVASEVFVRAFRGRAGYRAHHDEALPWLLGIANNVIADHRRLERRRLAALERLTRETPEVVEHGESGLAPELVAALRALPAVERDTLLLVVWGELTQEQAAVAVGVPVGKALTSSVSPATTEDTAYIIRRVKANIASSVENGTVVRYATYAGGDVAADGSLINLGRKLSDAYEYVAPDGTSDSRGALCYSDGTIELTSFDRWTPGLAGRVGADIETVLNPTTHRYSRNQYRSASNLNEGPSAILLFRTPAQVQQALQSGEVIRHGTATVDGTRVIALSLEVPNAPGNPSTQIALYLDAQTYQPLRTVSVQNGAPDLSVGDWDPATPDNIALAKDRTIPAGYTKTSLRQVYDGTYNH